MDPNPLRIVLVTHYFSTHRGGVERVAGELACRIAANPRYQVTWFASDCDGVPARQDRLQFEPMITWNGLERRGLPWPVWGIGALTRLKRAVADADVVHIHDFIYFGSLAALALAKWHRKPVVCTQHIGDIPYESRTLASVLKGINGTIGCFVLSMCEQVVFISDAVRRQFASRCSLRRDPNFWPNGVDTRIYQPATSARRMELRERLARHSVVCLFVGRFVEKKGLRILRALAQEFPDVEWWFAGSGAPTAELDPSTWALSNIDVFTDRSGTSLAELYQAADLLVLPSRGEGFPLVVQESMACGTPAMVFADTGAGVPEARHLLYEVDVAYELDPAVRWSAALDSILNGGWSNCRRANVADYAREHWSWDTCANRYCALFNTLRHCDEQLGVRVSATKGHGE